jgi:hypothetical protein
MFHDLLDQPRRELEAVKAKCEAQEARIAKLEAIVSAQMQQMTDFEGKFKLACAKLEKLDDNRVILRNQRLVSALHVRFPDELGLNRCIQDQTQKLVVYEGMRIGDSRPQFDSHYFKNGAYVKPDPRCTSFGFYRVSQSHLNEFVEIFMFQPSEWCIREVGVEEKDWKRVDWNRFDWKQLYMSGHPKVYVRIVELESGHTSLKPELFLKLPSALFYIFKYMD